MSAGEAEREQGARRSGKARVRATEDAMGQISSAYGKGRTQLEKEQKRFDPYADIGKTSLSYFQNYANTGGIDIWKKYQDLDSPINEYYAKKTSQAIDRAAAARGSYGGGAAITAQAEGASSLQAKLSELASGKVNTELGTMMNLLNTGYGATTAQANLGTNIANLYTEEGRLLSDLELQKGSAIGNMEESIGASRAAGKKGEQAALLSAGGVALGALAPFLGGLSPIAGNLAAGASSAMSTIGTQQIINPNGTPQNQGAGGATAGMPALNFDLSSLYPQSNTGGAVNPGTVGQPTGTSGNIGYGTSSGNNYYYNKYRVGY